MTRADWVCESRGGAAGGRRRAGALALDSSPARRTDDPGPAETRAASSGDRIDSGRAGVAEPDAPSLEYQSSRFWLFDTIVSLLALAADETPLLILLDDLHWADATSLLLLQFLTAELVTVPLLVLGTYRDTNLAEAGSLAQFLASVSRHRWCRRLALAGLSESEVGELIENVAGTRPTDRVAKVFRERTGGNPFFLTETMRLFGEGKWWDGEGHSRRKIPDTVREAGERRLERLPPRSVEVLRYASVVGQDFHISSLFHQAEWAEDAVRVAIDQAVDARLMASVAETSRYRFRHALVREFLYAQSPTAQRQQWHADLAARLEKGRNDNPALPVSAIAHHYAMAGAMGDPTKAFKYSVLAGDQAIAALAYEDAVSHYRQAVTCQQEHLLDATGRYHLLLALGDAHRKAGNWEESRDSFREAAQLARTLGESGSLFARAALGFCGLIARAPVDQEAVALLREALALVGEENTEIRVRLLCALAFALHFDAEPQTRMSLSAEAIIAARALNEPSHLAEALEARLNARVGRCGTDELEQLASEAVALGQSCNDQGRVFRCRIFRYLVLLQTGRSSAAQAELRECTALAAALRYPKYLWQVAVIEAGQATAKGRFALAAQLIDKAQRIETTSMDRSPISTK